MDLKDFFGQRLKNARIMRGLSMEGLAMRAHQVVSKQTISKYEMGKMLPSSAVLIALANALEVSVDYLVRPFSISLDHIEFRKKARQGAKSTAAIKEIVRDKVERYLEIENILSITTSYSYSLGEMTIKSEGDVVAAANRVKRDWQLGNDGITNVIAMLEAHQIKVIELDDAPSSFDGLSGFADHDKPIIVLNGGGAYTAERKRLTALHELGHIVMNFDPALTDKQREQMCNLFASEMLISKEIFTEILGDHRHDISLNEMRDIQRNFGISIDALMYKARHLGIISEPRYRYYCMMKNQKPDFKRQIQESHYALEKSDRFQRLVYRALACDLISFSKAAALLEVTIEDVREQIDLL